MFYFWSRHGTTLMMSAFCRLRVGGFHVVDVTRPRAVSDTVATNHGGIAAVAFTDARLELLDIGATPSTFEFA